MHFSLAPFAKRKKKKHDLCDRLRELECSDKCFCNDGNGHKIYTLWHSFYSLLYIIWLECQYITYISQLCFKNILHLAFYTLSLLHENTYFMSTLLRSLITLVIFDRVNRDGLDIHCTFPVFPYTKKKRQPWLFRE